MQSNQKFWNNSTTIDTTKLLAHYLTLCRWISWIVPEHPFNSTFLHRNFFCRKFLNQNLNIFWVSERFQVVMHLINLFSNPLLALSFDFLQIDQLACSRCQSVDSINFFAAIFLWNFFLKQNNLCSKTWKVLKRTSAPAFDIALNEWEENTYDKKTNIFHMTTIWPEKCHLRWI